MISRSPRILLGGLLRSSGGLLYCSVLLRGTPLEKWMTFSTCASKDGSLHVTSNQERAAAGSSSIRKIHVPVLIVGGGPVGLTMALLLQKGGVPTLLLEQQAAATCLPKAHYITNRSMESECTKVLLHRRFWVCLCCRCWWIVQACLSSVYLVFASFPVSLVNPFKVSCTRTNYLTSISTQRLRTVTRPDIRYCNHLLEVPSVAYTCAPVAVQLS